MQNYKNYLQPYHIHNIAKSILLAGYFVKHLSVAFMNIKLLPFGKGSWFHQLQVISIMSTSSNLPFSSINPIKCIGLNQQNPFCSIVSEGKLIYTSGANIIMENTKTNQQKILFNNTFCGEVELIHHHVTLYNEHLLGIAIKDSTTLMHIIVIIPLNPIIFNEEAKKEKMYTHYMKTIEQFQEIQQIEFFDEGNLFAVVSNYQSLNNLALFRTISGEAAYQQSFIDTKISIQGVCVNKMSCISILQQNNKRQIRLCLIVLDQLSRKFYYNLSLQKHQDVIEYFSQSFQQQSNIVVLTSLGFVLIYKINEYEIILMNRIDLRQPRRLTTSESRHQRTEVLSNNEDKANLYYRPIAIQPASNKVVLAYQQSCMVGVLFYSHYNPKNTKFSIIEEAVSNLSFVKEIKSIKMAKDNCSLAALLEIYPQKMEFKTCMKENDQSLMNSQHITAFQIDNELRQTNLEAQIIISNNAEILGNEGDAIKQKHYIALQIDILSNMIEHQEQARSTELTFSLLSGHNIVLKVEYCTYNNTMFMLMKNKMIKYYDLTPKEHQNQYKSSIPMYKQFKIQGLLLWEKLLNDQPHSMTVHPFNFTILLVYEEILKFHYFNIKSLFPAFIITSIKNCNLAKYSPLGDKIVLATNGAVIILNCYTFEVMKTVALPNILTQTQIKRFSSVRQKLPVFINPKVITDFVFQKNGDILAFSGHNSFSLIVNNEKSCHFGFIQLSKRQRFHQILYDSTNNLIILLQQYNILILTKSNINSKNRCQVVSKIEISATSAVLVQQLGILFLGGRDGVLHMLKWPDYCQQQLYARTTNKYYQFRQPIIGINVSTNYNYIYTVSKSGSFCISQLQVNQNDEGLPKELSALLLTASQKPLRQGNRWLISRADEERKEREIIKLRGEEADIANHHYKTVKKSEISQDQMIKEKKIELEAAYVKELKEYEQRLGLQHNLQSISLLKDQNRIFQQKRRRQINQINCQKEDKMKQIFEERTKLQRLYNMKVKQNQQKLQTCIQQKKAKMQQLVTSLQKQESGMIRKKQAQASDQVISRHQEKCTLANRQQDHVEDMHLINLQHNQEIEDLLNVNQTILSKNRYKNIEIHDFQDKIGDLNIEKEKLQFDMYMLMDERARYDELKEKIMQQNDHYKKTYDKLIKVSNQLEDKVIYERKEQKRYEYKIGTLQEQIATLCNRQHQLSQQRAKVNADFIQQKNMNALKAKAIHQLNAKYDQLRDLKKEKNYQNCLLKNQYTQIIKTFMRKMEVNQEQAIREICQAYKSSTFQKKKESVRNSEFQILKAQHEKMAKDATKWKEVKQSYMNAFFRNHKKLDQQNMKLTYRYNDLLRLSQQYKVQISNLQQNIQRLQKSNSDWKSLPKVSESKVAQARSRLNFSFLNVNKKQNKQNKTKLKKKLICVSLHQQSGKFITQV